MAGKCPSADCGKVITYLNFETVPARDGVSSWNTVIYKCPLCHTIVSAQIDPVALKTDTVNAIAKRLKASST